MYFCINNNNNVYLHLLILLSKEPYFVEQFKSKKYNVCVIKCIIKLIDQFRTNLKRIYSFFYASTFTFQLGVIK